VGQFGDRFFTLCGMTPRLGNPDAWIYPESSSSHFAEYRFQDEYRLQAGGIHKTV
jgi:hypothetical protein